MVVESLLSPYSTRNMMKSLILGVVLGSLGIFMSMWIFEDQASMVMVFLTVLGATPFFYKTMMKEEEIDVSTFREGKMLISHARAISFLISLFLGMTIAYSFWYIALPAELSMKLFQVQTHTITSLNQNVTGGFSQFSLLSKIFMNNVKVMIFCILFSFIYGAGAVFILTWNASVIGAAIGNFFKSHIAQYATAVGLEKIAAYFYVTSMSILRYIIHGVPEILAYFVAGLAGGIISAAVIKHDVGTKHFERILLDASDLVLLSIAILFVAALLEVFVTPTFF